MNKGVAVGISAALPTYLMVVPLASCTMGTQSGVFCVVRADPVLKLVGGLVTTAETFHPLMFWLNTDAYSNMDPMIVTALVFHVPMG